MDIFKTCYHLVTGINGGNNMRWFFTFTNRSTEAMEGTLQGKSAHVKKWKGRWLIIRYNGQQI
jgi:hypothetical protein